MNGSNVHPRLAAGEEIEIPEGVRVRCPLVEFRLRKVGECPGCRHFRGLTDRFPGGKHAFAVRYSVLCAAEPAKRELFEIEA